VSTAAATTSTVTAALWAFFAPPALETGPIQFCAIGFTDSCSRCGVTFKFDEGVVLGGEDTEIDEFAIILEVSADCVVTDIIRNATDVHSAIVNVSGLVNLVIVHLLPTLVLISSGPIRFNRARFQHGAMHVPYGFLRIGFIRERNESDILTFVGDRIAHNLNVEQLTERLERRLQICLIDVIVKVPHVYRHRRAEDFGRTAAAAVRGPVHFNLLPTELPSIEERHGLACRIVVLELYEAISLHAVHVVREHARGEDLLLDVL